MIPIEMLNHSADTQIKGVLFGNSFTPIQSKESDTKRVQGEMKQSKTDRERHKLDEIIDQIGFGHFQVMAMIGLGCRIFVRGSITSSMAILESYFQCKYQLSHFTVSFYLTAYLFSIALFSWPSGWIADNYGKRKTIILLSSMSVIAALLHVFSQSFTMLVITITAFGLFENALYFVYPYLIELLPISKRKYMPVMEVFFVFGFLSGTLITFASIRYASWQLTIGFSLVIPLLMTIVFVWFMPESPIYLYSVKDRAAVLQVLLQMMKKNMPKSDLKQVFLHEKIVSLFEEESDSSEDELMEEIEVQNLLRSNTNHLNQISLNNSGDSLSSTDVWKRIIVLCIVRYSISICRSTIIYASGQSYYMVETIEACMRCAIGIEIRNLLSVCFGFSTAAIISYNLVHYVKRRTALLSLLLMLSLIAFPFYYVSTRWIITALIYLSSMTADCLFIIMFVYVSEMVPTSVRGVTVGLVSCCGILGEACSAILATYFLHINFVTSLNFLHSIIVICLLVTYFFAIETKDTSLH